MTTDTEDRHSWPQNGLVIRRDELLRLIEENGGPDDLDLRGAIFVGEGQEVPAGVNPIDLSPEALTPLAAVYGQQHGGSKPPWCHPAGGVCLSGARLKGADLSGARLQRAVLGYAHLQGAFLLGAELQGADLRDAQLQGAVLINAELQGARLGFAQLQETNLTGAQLQGAYLGFAQLHKAALMDAQLQGADLMDAQLQGANLINADLKEADLRSAQIERVDMYRVASLVGAHWHGAFLEYTRIGRRDLGQSIGDEDEARRHGSAGFEERLLKAEAYSDASEAYLLLKNNFNQIGRYEDASWAYVKEQQVEKTAYYWEWRALGWRARGSLWRWLRNWAYELATGYGERVYMPVLWAIVVVAVFAGIYAVAGNIASGDVGALQGEPTHNPLIALVHSISAFATIGFNTLEPQGWGARLLTALEAMFGVGLFALFIFTLGNRMSRS
jgi:uncharacterized protein YjbI with pentapeptide repeats